MCPLYRAFVLYAPNQCVWNHVRSHTVAVCLPCVLRVYSFASLIRWTPLLTFTDTAVTDRHSNTTFFPAQSALGADI